MPTSVASPFFIPICPSCSIKLIIRIGDKGNRFVSNAEFNTAIVEKQKRTHLKDGVRSYSYFKNKNQLSRKADSLRRTYISACATLRASVGVN